MDFFEYYANLFGPRWESLQKALLGENKPKELQIENATRYRNLKQTHKNLNIKQNDCISS